MMQSAKIALNWVFIWAVVFAANQERLAGEAVVSFDTSIEDKSLDWSVACFDYLSLAGA